MKRHQWRRWPSLSAPSVLALGRASGLPVDRAGAAVIGAGLMAAAGSIGYQEALSAVDWPAIVLLPA